MFFKKKQEKQEAAATAVAAPPPPPLMSQDRLLEAVLEKLPIAVAIFSPDLHLKYGNTPYTDLVSKFCRCDPHGCHLRELVPPARADEIEEGFRTVRITGQPFHDPDREYVSPDGIPSYWCWAVSLLPGEGVEDFCAIGVEVSDQVHFRQEMEEVAMEADRERQQLNLIMQNAPVGIALLDSDLRYIQVNRMMAQIHGISPDAHVGRKYRDVSPRLADTFEPLLRKVIETDQPAVNVTITGRPGKSTESPRIWTANVYALKMASNRTAGVAIILSDVTDLQQAQMERERLLLRAQKQRQLAQDYAKEVRQTNQTLNSLIESIPAAVLVCDLEGNFTLTNREARQLLGQLTGNVDGTNQVFRLYKEDGTVYKPEERPLYKARTQGIVTKGFQAIARFDDGRQKTLEIFGQPIRDKSGEITGAVAVLLDKTEQVRIQNELREAQRYLQGLLDSSPLPVASLDNEGRVRLWNPACEAMFGYAREEVLGKPLPTVPPSEEEDALAIRHVAAQGIPQVNRPVRRMTKSGEILQLSISVAILRDAEGTIIGSMGVYSRREKDK